MGFSDWEEMSKLISRPPVGTKTLDYSGTNVGSAAWVELVASLGFPATAVEIFNGSGSLIQIAKGSAGNEVAVPYVILPGGSSVVLPLEFSNGNRLSLKTGDGTTAAFGYLVMNFFG